MVRSLLILALVAGCVRGGGSYRCASNNECVLEGATGVCESVGYCSFPDPGCESGSRYGVHSGAYANDCVTGENSGFVDIGGTVTGLNGMNLVLRNNGTDDLLITTGGAFTFNNPVMVGVPYEVTVAAQPSNPAQNCLVNMGAGVAGGADVTDVEVTCSTATYTLGGVVLGLNGTIVLTNNGGDDTQVMGNNANVNFTFATQVASGAMFDIAIKTQPGGQTCSVSGGTGTVGSANVSSVVVNCNAGTYTVGGSVSGLQGTLVLDNNGTDNATVTSNGSFAFPMPLATASNYAVTVETAPTYPPRHQTCSITGGTGTVGVANVTSVSVMCTTSSFTIGGTVNGLTGTLVLQNGADMLTITQTGMFTFGTAVLSGNTYNVSVATQPSGQTCSVTGATGTVANGNVTNVTVNCTVAGADPGILCGGSLYCDPAAGQLCCITNNVPACTTSCPGGQNTPIRCDTQADCTAAGSPATVCCGTVDGPVTYNTYCGGPSQCTAPKAYYCDPNIATPCPHGGTCTATMYPFPGYYRCF